MNPNLLKPRISFSNSRFNFFFGIIIFILAIFIVRLFYIQVIEHQTYKNAALSGQLKEYEIPAERGIIQAHDGTSVVPIVLNEEVYTLFADPIYVKDIDSAAAELSKITGDKQGEYKDKMNADTRYAVLAKRLDKTKKEKIEKLDIKGVGLRAESIRTYPQKDLASQVLGFVNAEGVGTYGLEQFLDSQLRGTPGQLKAITDSRGVPLVSNEDNILKDAVPGERVTLTLDIGMQRKVEGILKEHVKSLSAKSGSALIIDPNNGAVKAMANYPTYDPAKYYEVKDPSVFTNASVSSALEVGSIMKTLTVGAGLNENVIKADSTFFDPGKLEIDGATVRNVEESGGAGARSISDILSLSLNTGAVYVLKQLGGGEINEKGRAVWHDYMVNHYLFGQKTGIEQGYESAGQIPDPEDGFGRNIKYANTSFGQGLLITPLQIASAFSATINGGKYYQPHLVEPGDGKAVVIKKDNVVSEKVSKELRGLHENSVNSHYSSLIRTGYKVGGKTGTAQIASPDGGYYSDRFNGTFIGYIGGDKPEYVIIVRVDEPKINNYAGAFAAKPLFEKIMDMLINNFSIPTVSR